jgi:hypothetical protein
MSYYLGDSGYLECCAVGVKASVISVFVSVMTKEDITMSSKDS